MELINFSKDDIYLFHQGNHFHSYNFLGSHIISRDGKQGVLFNLWAPNASYISIVGDFNNWDESKNPMIKNKDCNIWSIFIDNLNEYDIYKYHIKSKNNKVKLKSDPYAFHSELRPNTASVIYNINDFIWSDKKWMKDRENKNYLQEPMNIYEVHLGSWKQKQDGEFYTYREMADMLSTYLKDMNYTHIELMPIIEHPFDGSWGYQGTGYYSVTSRYGEPKDFMYFVNKMHEEGIGVILDWVPGHFCKDEHGLYEFDGTHLFGYEDEDRRENLGWGTSNFDHGRPEVCSFLISNAVYFFDKFHIDGMRIDAVANMLYLNFGKEDGELRKNKYGGTENLESIRFLKKLHEAVFRYFKNPLMMAEESTDWPLVTAPTYIGGLGFNFKWNMGWMNDILKYMEMDSIFRKWHHGLLTFSFEYTFSENYVLSLSHDEVVHGKKSLIDKMYGSYEQKFSSLRLLMAFMIAHPGKKLLFMGCEFAQFREWDYSNSLEWFMLDYPIHDNFKNFMKVLNKFYLDQKPLYELDLESEGFSWIDGGNYKQSIIAFLRKSKIEDDFLICIFNFTPVTHDYYKIGVPKMGIYKEILNTDYECFCGLNNTNEADICTIKEEWNGYNQHIQVKIAPLSATFIKLKDIDSNLYRINQK